MTYTGGVALGIRIDQTSHDTNSRRPCSLKLAKYIMSPSKWRTYKNWEGHTRNIVLNHMNGREGERGTHDTEPTKTVTQRQTPKQQRQQKQQQQRRRQKQQHIFQLTEISINLYWVVTVAARPCPSPCARKSKKRLPRSGRSFAGTIFLSAASCRGTYRIV